MKLDTNFCYKDPEGFVIENGIFRGAEDASVIKHDNCGEYVLEGLRAAPEFVGQVDGLTGRKETFAEMTERSVKCAMWMKDQGVKPGDVVGICTYNQMDMYVPYFASFYIGAVANPWWSNGLTKEMAKYILTLTGCNILFADVATADLILEVAKEANLPVKICVFGDLPGFQSLNDVLATQDSSLVSEFRCTKLPTPEHPATMLFTSGSTGLPKVAVSCHKSVLETAVAFMKLGDPKGVEVLLTFAPLAWGTTAVTVIGATGRRRTRVIHPEFSEESTLELIEKFKVNWMLLGTSSAVRIQQSPAIQNYDLSSLKYLYVCGAVFKENTHRALMASLPNTSVRQLFGMTELGLVLDQYSEPPVPGSCGKIVKNVMMKVIDTNTGSVLGPNQMGEVCFRTVYKSARYYKNPEASKELVDAGGWLHTGDLGRYDEKGNVFITERIKEMIKYRENPMSPAMIEQVLQTHPEVTEAAVMGLPHDVDDEHPIAFVAIKPNARVTKEDLEKLVADTLPDYMKLRGGVQFLKELPRTPNGKISRGELKKLCRSLPSRV